MKIMIVLSLPFLSFQVLAASLDQHLDSLPALARAANSRPVVNQQTGKIKGYEDFRIESGAQFGKMEFTVGDVISEIEGIRIETPAKAMELFNMHKSENINDIVIENKEQEKGEN